MDIETIGTLLVTSLLAGSAVAGARLHLAQLASGSTFDAILRELGHLIIVKRTDNELDWLAIVTGQSLFGLLAKMFMVSIIVGNLQLVDSREKGGQCADEVVVIDELNSLFNYRWNLKESHNMKLTNCGERTNGKATVGNELRDDVADKGECFRIYFQRLQIRKFVHKFAIRLVDYLQLKASVTYDKNKTIVQCDPH